MNPNMSIPIIGVLPLWDDDSKNLYMHPAYMNGIMCSGGLPLVLPLVSDKMMISVIARSVDGLLFTGGHDIFPGLYGENISASCGTICKIRDDMESSLFTEAVLNMGIPAFGICRGLQFINAALGGTLYQDLPTQFCGKVLINHQQEQSDDVPAHCVQIDTNSPLYSLLGTKTLSVNSTHHQGIRVLSPALERMAIADDGLIESVYMPGKRFVWAVQWHPESILHEESSRNLFGAFVAASGKTRSIC